MTGDLRMARIGYRLTAPDNGRFMHDDISVARCAKCSMPLDGEVVNEAFEVPRSVPDASYTCDGYFIVSTRLADMLVARGGVAVPLKRSPGFSSLTARETVAFDVDRRGTRREDFCDVCNRYVTVAGARPIYLTEVSGALPDRLLRTDVEFGTGDEQHPLLLVGPGLGDTLITGSFSGLELRPIDESARRALTR